jgi:tRNA(Ile)-lysidine synthase TilS/MesJ
MINLLRGTGWRGIAPFGDKEIFRPMLNLTKADIYRYASEHQLHFRQDQSNNDDTYLRNRVRQKLSKELDAEIKQKVLQLYRRQVEIREDADKIIADLVGVEPAISRDLLDETSVPENIELLRGFLKMHDCAITRPQAGRCLREIKNFTNGKKYSIDKTHFLVVGKHNYRLQFD